MHIICINMVSFGLVEFMASGTAARYCELLGAKDGLPGIVPDSIGSSAKPSLTFYPGGRLESR
jgi:hypothetical protein